MFDTVTATLCNEQVDTLKNAGMYKEERIITSPQQASITTSEGAHVLNFCSNNYLGLANHPDIIEAAKKGLDNYGFGMSSVRFICGTQSIHKNLEKQLSGFLGTDDTILYSSCFDANGGLFETLLTADDAVISDQLNHASIIDGIRLCKAQRFRYANNNMEDLETKLKEAKHCRIKLIVTDGVFSMDGIITNLTGIIALAEKYNALVMVDDSHAVGVIGKKGRGTHEYHNVIDKVDIITGTLGKALGGASGGYTSGKKEIINLLRQRSRPYLFSNNIAPPIAAASLQVLSLLQSSNSLRNTLNTHTARFRKAMTSMGFTIVPGEHPIVPVMLGDAQVAQDLATLLLTKGIYVIGFSYPVVPKGQARIRVQISAAHSDADIDCVITAFAEAGKELNIIEEMQA